MQCMAIYIYIYILVSNLKYKYFTMKTIFLFLPSERNKKSRTQGANYFINIMDTANIISNLDTGRYLC